MNSRHLVVAVFSLQEGTKDKQEECCSAPFWVRFLVLIYKWCILSYYICK